MLRQASVSDLISEKVTRDDAYVVITMRRYPRFVNRTYRDEYISCLSPSRELHEAWLSAKRRHHDHNGAFARSRFEERFKIEDEGYDELKRLVEKARQEDVYIVCQCQLGLRCHREMVLLLAKALYDADVESPKNAYPAFRKRLPEFKQRLRELKRRDAVDTVAAAQGPAKRATSKTTRQRRAGPGRRRPKTRSH